MLLSIAALLLIAETTSAHVIIDTHAHLADLSLLGDYYTYPTAFPALDKSWTMQDYAEATATVEGLGVLLMTLEKNSSSPEETAQAHVIEAKLQVPARTGFALSPL